MIGRREERAATLANTVHGLLCSDEALASVRVRRRACSIGMDSSSQLPLIQDRLAPGANIALASRPVLQRHAVAMIDVVMADDIVC